MRKLVFRLIRYTGLPFIFREFFQRSKVTILCYHKLDENIASKTFNFLNKNYNIISLLDFINAIEQKKTNLLPKKALVITIDDGYKENYTLIERLKTSKIPVTIFLCSELIGTNRKPWYEHVHPDFNLFELQNIPNQERLSKMEKIGFSQTFENDDRYMMSKSEIKEISNYCDLQAHTMFHPCLPTCTEKEAYNEIVQSKANLENEFGIKVKALAYPNGDYSERDISIVKNAGYSCAVTLDFGYNSIYTDPFRLKRLGVNDTDDINEISVKASGVWLFFKTRNGKKQHYGLKNIIE